MKAFRLKFMFRFLAMLDVIFAEQFELKVYKNGKQISKTKFSKKEINDAFRKK